MTKETIVNEENEEVRISPEVEQQVIQQWETIGISNDFVFCKIMQDEELLSELIHPLLFFPVNSAFAGFFVYTKI